MHLAHPALSTTGKKKGKHKFRNADQARKSRELDVSWKELQKKWATKTEVKKHKRALSAKVYNPPVPNHRGVGDPKIPSRVSSWDPCIKPPDKVYTGSEMIGIGQLHKSNAIPIFKKSDAEDLAKMRR
jgi:hypothetical protein